MVGRTYQQSYMGWGHSVGYKTFNFNGYGFEKGLTVSAKTASSPSVCILCHSISCFSSPNQTFTLNKAGISQWLSFSALPPGYWNMYVRNDKLSILQKKVSEYCHSKLIIKRLKILKLKQIN